MKITRRGLFRFLGGAVGAALVGFPKVFMAANKIGMSNAGAVSLGEISPRTAAWTATQMLHHADPVIVLCKFSAPLNPKRVSPYKGPCPEPIVPTARNGIARSA